MSMRAALVTLSLVLTSASPRRAQEAAALGLSFVHEVERLVARAGGAGADVARLWLVCVLHVGGRRCGFDLADPELAAVAGL